MFRLRRLCIDTLGEHVVFIHEEAVRAGITQIVIITGRNKSALEDHFDRSPELESALERSGKQTASFQQSSYFRIRTRSELASPSFTATSPERDG